MKKVLNNKFFNKYLYMYLQEFKSFADIIWIDNHIKKSYETKVFLSIHVHTCTLF